MKRYAFVLLSLAAAAPAAGQEMLANGNFEAPVVPADGNNFYATIPNWTVVADTGNPQPVNLIRPTAAYAGNPSAPPSGGGTQYFDVNASSGTVRQTVTLPGAGMVDIGAWFSVRDNQQDLTGCIVNIRNSANAVVATITTSFVAADPIGLWKRASANNVPLAAGSYTFEIVLPNPANLDLATMVFKPPLNIAKVSAPLSDPVNGATNPKLIPGAFTQYTIAVSSPPAYSATNNSITIVDPTPAGTDMAVNDFGGTGSGPAAFVQGSPSSTLTYSYAGLASQTDDIDFSNNGGAAWTYVPVANASGVDPAVTHVRLQPKGSMAAFSSFSFRLRYRVR